MKKLFSLTILLLILTSSGMMAQEIGKLHLYSHVPGTVFKVEEDVYEVDEFKELKLAPGDYQVSAWAPNRKAVSRTVTVVADKTVIEQFTLEEYSEAYFEFYKDKRKKKAIVWGVAGLAVAGDVFFLLRKSKAKRDSELNYSSVLNAADWYSTAIDPETLDASKSQHEFFVEAYRNDINKHNSSVIGIAVSSVVLAAALTQINRQGKIKFQDKNPFVKVKVCPQYDWQQHTFSLNTKITF